MRDDADSGAGSAPRLARGALAECVGGTETSRAREADVPDMRSAAIEALSRNIVFGALAAESLARIGAAATPVRVERGAQLFQAGDPSDAAYVLVTGRLAVVTIEPDGQEFILAELDQGSVIGEIAVLDGGARSAGLVAVRKCHLLRLSRELVLSALQEEPQAALRLAMVLASRLRNTNLLAVETATANVGVRLARVLLREGEPNTRSQSDLARLVSSSRETINRCLARWRARGLVRRDRRGIWIADRVAVSALAEGERPPLDRRRLGEPGSPL